MMGPLPLGGWVAVVGGGLGLAYVAKRGGGDDEELIEPVVPVYPATPATAGARNLAPALPDNTQAPPPITDNGEWMSVAVRKLTTLGYAPYTTQQCLARYLEGVIQGGDCVAIIDKALTLVGPPPTGAPVNQFPMAPPVANAPPKPTTPPKTTAPAVAGSWTTSTSSSNEPRAAHIARLKARNPLGFQVVSIQKNGNVDTIVYRRRYR